ncbi:MAG: VWA domain-containing protein [Burkholderiales bacterium]|nr:VWA domain-containing protein [Burkholderiales bacterium]
MRPPADPATASVGGHLTDHVVQFARVLRTAGLPVGPDRVVDALRALQIVGVRDRRDFRATLAALFVDRHERRAVFDHAFDAYWRDPRRLEHALATLAPGVLEAADAPRPAALPRRLEALAPARLRTAVDVASPPRAPDIDATGTHSARERLRHADFGSMTTAEADAAKHCIAALRLPVAEVRTRRLRPDARGPRIDLRDSLRASLRLGPDALVLRRRGPRFVPPPLVVLCDISGSMARYSRLFLHFAHALTDARGHVDTFVFGTRLTRITHALRHRDVDVAVDAATRVAVDWAGGTRIGAALAEFNLRWSRRVLGARAVVLLITDGLDRADTGVLAAAMERLHKSCHRLLWLNPLLRHDGFRAIASGPRAMQPHVDALLPVHNLASLADLGRALADGDAIARRAPRRSVHCAPSASAGPLAP